jgi:hypothetical protein
MAIFCNIEVIDFRHLKRLLSSLANQRRQPGRFIRSLSLGDDLPDYSRTVDTNLLALVGAATHLRAFDMQDQNLKPSRYAVVQAALNLPGFTGLRLAVSSRALERFLTLPFGRLKWLHVSSRLSRPPASTTTAHFSNLVEFAWHLETSRNQIGNALKHCVMPRLPRFALVNVWAEGMLEHLGSGVKAFLGQHTDLDFSYLETLKAEEWKQILPLVCARSIHLAIKDRQLLWHRCDLIWPHLASGLQSLCLFVDGVSMSPACLWDQLYYTLLDPGLKTSVVVTVGVLGPRSDWPFLKHARDGAEHQRLGRSAMKRLLDNDTLEAVTDAPAFWAFATSLYFDYPDG